MDIIIIKQNYNECMPHIQIIRNNTALTIDEQKYIDAWIKESIKWGNGFVIFAKQQKKIVGIALLEFLHFDPQNQFDQPKMLHFIWVDPKMRQKGVGKLLLQQESEVYGTPCSDSADKFFTGIGWHISPNGPSLDGCYLWQTPQEQNKSNLEITT